MLTLKLHGIQPVPSQTMTCYLLLVQMDFQWNCIGDFEHIWLFVPFWVVRTFFISAVNCSSQAWLLLELNYLCSRFTQEPWIVGLMAFHVLFLLMTILSRKNINFQMCLFLFGLCGVYLAETLNGFLRHHWKSFAGQNYFDTHGIFLSVLWSGPLLVIAIIILVNTLFSLCYLIVRWKRAELRHRARLARKED